MYLYILFIYLFSFEIQNIFEPLQIGWAREIVQIFELCISDRQNIRFGNTKTESAIFTSLDVKISGMPNIYENIFSETSWNFQNYILKR